MAQVRIRSTDPGIIVDELTGRVATAPKFFQRTAVCLDLSELGREPGRRRIARRGRGRASRRHAARRPGQWYGSDGYPGARGGHAGAGAVSRHQQDSAGGARGARSRSRNRTVSPLIHTQAVRSGQRLYARRRDLIVMAPVGAGAELMADGCAHVYSALRGRVMAGARGDTRARVFCQAVLCRAGLDRRACSACSRPFRRNLPASRCTPGWMGMRCASRGWASS